MAHVKDEGMFDAPVERIWKYLQDNTPGVHVHKSLREMKPVGQQGNAVTFEMEFVNPDGTSTRKESWRMTMNPPHGFDMEALTGISKGTKYSHKYTPMGARTKVEVEGEFHMQGMDEGATRQAALGFLAEVFDEDNSTLKRYK